MHKKKNFIIQGEEHSIEKFSENSIRRFKKSLKASALRRKTCLIFSEVETKISENSPAG
jgi:hypothetical protein